MDRNTSRTSRILSRDPCHCQPFRANLKPGDSFKCGDCGQIGDGGSAEEDADLLPSTAGGSSTCAQAGSAQGVRDIFEQITGRPAATTQRSTSRQWDRGHVLLPKPSARGEALSTFSSGSKATEYQKLARGPTPHTTTQTGLRKSSRAPTTSSSTTFRVSSIGMLVCGVDKHGMLRASKIPSKGNSLGELQKMKNRGCYHDGELFTIDSSWSYEKTTAKIIEWFPAVSEYIRSNGLDCQLSEAGKVLPWWRLLVKNGYTLSVVEAVNPTGAHLLKNKGRDKAGVADSHLWFATRNRIPEDVYESWNTQPIIAGSDSDRDGTYKTDTDECSDSDDKKLASSLGDLALFERDSDGRRDVKGKGRYISKTPTTSRYGLVVKRCRDMRSPDSDSPSNEARIAVKKMKDAAAKAVPLFFKPISTSSQSPPNPKATWNNVFVTQSQHPLQLQHVSPPPAVITVTEEDVYLRNRSDPNDPDTPPMLNPWDRNYSILKLLDFDSLF